MRDKRQQSKYFSKINAMLSRIKTYNKTTYNSTLNQKITSFFSIITSIIARAGREKYTETANIFTVDNDTIGSIF
ncbi:MULTISPECIES: hypothetical protein [unclassified Acinetobacter]|uniref:hypothetical protein n=1 Tax=unclassified Acinetobacter TaxID=196816 RepID=UPI002934E6B2|nr:MULTISPECIES: hypothetical protein [unclassified Acinetobacter]WOE30539.1 hypothetical protein QSG84_09045 [Acinetobacter sp. SAAs470]WOE38731.1 hypothetical protein QSG86_02710 [Acinetobacter sp. SAAs474]